MAIPGAKFGELALVIEPELAERAIETFVRAGPAVLARRLESDYRRRAEALYRQPQGADREHAFTDLYQNLFDRTGFGQQLADSLGDFPALRQGLERLVIFQALRPEEEGSDLGQKTGSGGRPSAVLRIQAERFLHSEALRAFLRFYWLQLEDLLDPAFGYEGAEPFGEVSPAERRGLLKIYSLLWAWRTAARMRRRGWPVPGEIGAQEEALGRLLGPEGLRRPGGDGPVLDRSFGHAQIVEWARALRSRRGTSDSEVCALCRFPSIGSRPIESLPPVAAQAALRADFPLVEGVVCGHCWERYEILAEQATVETRVAS